MCADLKLAASVAAARLDRLLSAEETSNATQNRRVRCLVHANEAFQAARRGDQADMAFSPRRAAVDRDKAISNELAQVPKRHILFTKFYFEISGMQVCSTKIDPFLVPKSICELSVWGGGWECSD